MILTIIDTTGIQDYIFGTNQLRQIIGASYLVNCASRDWVKQALDEAGFKHNIINLDGKINSESDAEIFSNQTIESGQIQVEVIYAGGGNTVLLINDLPTAEIFVKLLTRRVLLDAPGLRLVVSHTEFDWNNQALGGADGVFQTAFTQIARRKSAPQPITYESGWGVTTECAFTGLPSVAIDKNKRPISSEVKAKLAAEDLGGQRLMNLISFGQYLDPPRDFDDMGRSEGEKSLLAVVHTDGNGMSKRLASIQNQFPRPQQNRECVKALRKFSISIQKSALTALQNTVDVLIKNTDTTGKLICGEVEIQDDRLPFRPVVFGGDDLTFVCDGRLGLSLAAYYLQAAAQQELSDGNKMYCRAGVAIVKTHYPFARAYGLAEDLCQSAKQFISETETEIVDQLEKESSNRVLQNYHVAAIDWHFALTGVLDNLSDIREREYRNKVGELNMRPLSIIKQVEISGDQNAPEVDSDWRTWDVFFGILDQLKNGENWINSHNKVKALRQVLRQDKQAVNHFCINYDTQLPEIPGYSPEYGWIGDRCVYFDPIEAMDVLISLKNAEIYKEGKA